MIDTLKTTIIQYKSFEMGEIRETELLCLKFQMFEIVSAFSSMDRYLYM